MLQVTHAANGGLKAEEERNRKQIFVSRHKLMHPANRLYQSDVEPGTALWEVHLLVTGRRHTDAVSQCLSDMTGNYYPADIMIYTYIYIHTHNAYIHTYIYSCGKKLVVCSLRLGLT
jgi:hypothetical protein